MVAAAFFDVDRTILQGSSLLALARPLSHEGLLPLPTVLRATMRQIWFTVRGLSDGELDKAAAAAAGAVAGVDAAELARVGAAAIPRTVLPRVFEEAREAIAAHKAAGDKVFLVSSAPIELVRELGRLLGADDVAGTVAEVDTTGKYTGRITTFCHGQAKADAVLELAKRHGIDLAASTAYGDSVSDLPMLVSVGHPVAVNPDPRLKRVAEMRGYPIRSFTTRPRGHGKGFWPPPVPRRPRPSPGDLGGLA